MIRVEQISKRFVHRVKGALHAVRDVSLDVAPGEFVTLLGPSGCGKTTTLRIVAGFEAPDAGRVWIGGEDVTTVLANRRGIGFVFQNYALFPHLTVFDNVGYGLRIRRASRAEIRRRVGEVLGLVGLAGYERQLPHQLSGGEQQRVALARAIVIRPRVLLFDEPLSNLDAALRVRMRTEIRQLQQTLGLAAIYVTHDQEEAMAISDRIAVMSAGRIEQEGSAEELYRRPQSEFVARFIGRTNLLTARVVAVQPDRLEVALDAGGPTLAVPKDAVSAAPGARVAVLVRPEVVELVAAGAGHGTDAGSGFAGTIRSRTFLGEKTEYVVRAGDATVQVTAYNDPGRGRLAIGDAVTLRVPGDAVLILPPSS